MVSHPETDSDSPIGSDQDRGRDIIQLSSFLSELEIYLSNPSKFISSLVLVYHTHKELFYAFRILHLCVNQRASCKSEQDIVHGTSTGNG